MFYVHYVVLAARNACLLVFPWGKKRLCVVNLPSNSFDMSRTPRDDPDVVGQGSLQYTTIVAVYV